MTGINDLPKLALKNRQAINQSKNAGCFHCLKLFPIEEIKLYTDNDQTAICPYCNTDCVIGDYCGWQITNESLKIANKFWYQ